MFEKAYLKLTVFYVVLLLLLSGLFSFWLYKEATRELSIGLRAPFGINQTSTDFYIAPNFDRDSYFEDRIAEGKRRVITNLVLLNVTILVGGGIASYWLARKTMRPIEDAMAAQHRFTADASHELRTPLATIKLENELLLQSGAKLSKDTREVLLSNLEEIDRMAKLADDLLVLARSEAITNMAEVDIDDVIANAHDQLRTMAVQKAIDIRSKLAPAKVYGHADSLQRAVVILLDNAIKYSPENSIVQLSTVLHGSEVVIKVADQGPGIIAEQTKYIFDRFYRSDEARTKTKVSGHGLGLSIAQKIVKQHNGTIRVEQGLKSGSVFAIALPLLKS